MKPKNITLQAVLVVLCAVIAALSFLNFNQLKELDVMRNDIQSLRRELDNVTGNFSNSIEAGITEIEKSLNQSASILASSSSLGAFNKTDRTATVRVQIVPKQYTDGLTVFFTYIADAGEPRMVEADKGNGHVFYANLDVPLCNELQLTAQLVQGAETQIQQLDTIYSLKQDFLLSLDAFYHGTCSYKEGILNLSGTTNASCYSPNAAVLYPTKGELQLLQGNQVIYTAPLSQTPNGDLTSTDGPFHSANQEYNLELQLEKELALTSGQTLEMVIVMEDTYGFHYRYLISRWLVDDTGALYYDNNSEMDPSALAIT